MQWLIKSGFHRRFQVINLGFSCWFNEHHHVTHPSMSFSHIINASAICIHCIGIQWKTIFHWLHQRNEYLSTSYSKCIPSTHYSHKYCSQLWYFVCIHMHNILQLFEKKKIFFVWIRRMVVLSRALLTHKIRFGQT